MKENQDQFCSYMSSTPSTGAAVAEGIRFIRMAALQKDNFARTFAKLLPGFRPDFLKKGPSRTVPSVEGSGHTLQASKIFHIETSTFWASKKWRLNFNLKPLRSKASFSLKLQSTKPQKR